MPVSPYQQPVVLSPGIWDGGRAFSTNSTSTSLTTPTTATTKPSGEGVVDLESAPFISRIKLVFYGTGADNATANFSVWEWHESYVNGSKVWLPRYPLVLAAVLSAAVGVSAGPILDTERFADTLTFTSGHSDYTIYSPANDTIADVEIYHHGASLIQVYADLVTATALNALVGGS